MACDFVLSHSHNGDMFDFLINKHKQIIISNRVSHVHEDDNFHLYSGAAPMDKPQIVYLS